MALIIKDRYLAVLMPFLPADSLEEVVRQGCKCTREEIVWYEEVRKDICDWSNSVTSAYPFGPTPPGRKTVVYKIPHVHNVKKVCLRCKVVKAITKVAQKQGVILRCPLQVKRDEKTRSWLFTKDSDNDGRK